MHACTRMHMMHMMHMLELIQQLELVIAKPFLPALLQDTVSPVERQLYGLPVRLGGLGILDPTSTANAAYSTSRAATEHLTRAIEGKTPFELATHRSTMRKARVQYKKEKAAKAKETAESVRINSLQSYQLCKPKRPNERPNIKTVSGLT